MAAQIQQVGHDVFASAFVDAMRPTLFIGMAVVLTAAAATLFSRARSDADATGVAAYPAAPERQAAAV